MLRTPCSCIDIAVAVLLVREVAGRESAVFALAAALPFVGRDPRLLRWS